MTIYIVSEKTPNPLLAAAIRGKYLNDHFQLADNTWLVSSKLPSVVSLCEELGIVKGSGIAGTTVFSISSYYGLHNPEVWDWLKAKMEAA